MSHVTKQDDTHKQGQGLPVVKTEPLTYVHSGRFFILTESTDAGHGELPDDETILIVMTFINVMCILVFLPANCKIARGIFKISTKKQPMFLFFVGVELSCIADLLTCVVDAVLLWVEAPDETCMVLGSFTMSTYCFLSLIIASICCYRCIAVAMPRYYKQIARRNVIQLLIAGILSLSVAIPALLQLLHFTEFRYERSPLRLGCALYLPHDTYYVYFTVFFMSTLGINSVFLATYLVLHFSFKTLLNVSPHVEALKKGALVLTTMTAISYFIAYTPGTVVYILICVSPNITNNLAYPYSIILDGVLRFMPRSNSCLMPFFLVSGNTMDRLTQAANLTKLSTRGKHTLSRKKGANKTRVDQSDNAAVNA